MSITVIDVAKEAGVSRTTVSNVFSGKGNYSDETRTSVLLAAKKLGYKPNLAAALPDYQPIAVDRDDFAFVRGYEHSDEQPFLQYHYG